MMSVIPIALLDVPVRCPQPDGSVWLRTGQCNRCGACCASGDPFAGEQTDPPSPCRMLGRDAAGNFRCTDRTSSVYVNGCAAWPSAPQHIEPYADCSYRFERVS